MIPSFFRRCSRTARIVTSACKLTRRVLEGGPVSGLSTVVHLDDVDTAAREIEDLGFPEWHSLEPRPTRDMDERGPLHSERPFTAPVIRRDPKSVRGPHIERDTARLLWQDPGFQYQSL